MSSILTIEGYVFASGREVVGKRVDSVGGDCDIPVGRVSRGSSGGACVSGSGSPQRQLNELRHGPRRDRISGEGL